MGKCQFMPQPLSVYCDTYNCRNQVVYQFGNPDGPKNLLIQICEECLESLLKDAVEKGLVPEAEPPKEKVKMEYRCEYCGKEFEKPGSLKMHKINCPQKPEK